MLKVILFGKSHTMKKTHKRSEILNLSQYIKVEVSRLYLNLPMLNESLQLTLS